MLMLHVRKYTSKLFGPGPPLQDPSQILAPHFELHCGYLEQELQILTVIFISQKVKIQIERDQYYFPPFARAVTQQLQLRPKPGEFSESLIPPTPLTRVSVLWGGSCREDPAWIDQPAGLGRHQPRHSSPVRGRRQTGTQWSSGSTFLHLHNVNIDQISQRIIDLSRKRKF